MSSSYTPIKCPNCSANLPAQKTNDTIFCEYCGTPYYRAGKTTQEPPMRPSAPPPPPPQQSAYTPPPVIPRTNTPTVVPPRPVVNIVVLLLLLMFYFVPGVLYLMHITSKQKEWDKKYGGRR